MKSKILLLFILNVSTLLSTELIAQTACENFKKSEQIRDGLPLGENLNVMKSIVLYWSKRCACESGAITGGTWDYTVEVGNRVYDNYINGKLTSYQGKYTGPPFPAPDRRMSVGDCKNDNNFNINIDASDCLNNKFDNSKDPQQFGNSFLLAKCECEKGVPTEQRAKELEATMKLNYDNAKKYYGSGFVLPQPLSYTACPIIQYGGVQSNTNQPQINLVYTGYESNAEKLRDEYIKTFGTAKEFNAYASGENIKRVGVAMAKVMSDQLTYIQGLSMNTDPNSLLLEFNQKTREIDRLKENYSKEFISYTLDVGTEILNNITNKEYGNALFQLGGFLNASIEKKKVDEDIAKKKAEMNQSKNKQIQELYFNTLHYTLDLVKKSIKDAAFNESEQLETYHLNVADNLMCQWNFMFQNYSSDNTNWLKHDCANISKINYQVNSSISKNDNYYINIASRKFEKFNYKNQGTYDFLDAAIMYASKAIEINPRPLYFGKLGDYHFAKGNNILSLGNYIIAQTLDYKILNENQNTLIRNLKHQIQSEIVTAVKHNKLEKIEQFLILDLDQIISINGLNLLDYSISKDEAEIAVMIVKHLKKNKSSKEIDGKLKRIVLLCSASNAHKTLLRLNDSGVLIDFKQNNQHPIDIAYNSYSVDAYNVLLANYKGTTNYQRIHEKRGIHVMQKGKDEIDLAVNLLNNLDDEKDLYYTISKMLDLISEKNHYAMILGRSERALNMIYSNSFFIAKIEKDFVEQIKIYPGIHSFAHLYIDNNLLRFESLPALNQLEGKDIKKIPSIDQINRPTDPILDATQIKTAFEDHIKRLNDWKNSWVSKEQSDRILHNYNAHLQLIENAINTYPNENAIHLIDGYVFNVISELNLYKSYSWGPTIGLDQYFDQFDFLQSKSLLSDKK